MHLGKRKREDDIGGKIIVPQKQVVGNAKKQKRIIQTNKQTLKRDIQKFGIGNVVTECSSEHIEEDVQVAANILRDICK